MPAVCRSSRISRLPPSMSGKTRHTGAPDSGAKATSVTICTFVPVKQASSVTICTYVPIKQAKQRQYLYCCTDKKQTNCAPAEKAKRGRRFGCVHAPSTYTAYVSICQHTSCACMRPAPTPQQSLNRALKEPDQSLNISSMKS